MLAEWFHHTWVYQHYLLFVLPLTFIYGLMAFAFIGFVGAIKSGSPSGYVDWTFYVILWAHFALAVVSFFWWFYELYLLFWP